MILRIGRELKELSPKSWDENGWLASTPESSLIVVPLFPQFSATGGLVRTPPLIDTSLPDRVIRTPSCCRQERVEAQSAAVEKFEIFDTPGANDVMIAARWEIDLSPGRLSFPSILFTRFSLIYDNVSTLLCQIALQSCECVS